MTRVLKSSNSLFHGLTASVANSLIAEKPAISNSETTLIDMHMARGLFR